MATLPPRLPGCRSGPVVGSLALLVATLVEPAVSFDMRAQDVADDSGAPSSRPGTSLPAEPAIHLAPVSAGDGPTSAGPRQDVSVPSYANGNGADASLLRPTTVDVAADAVTVGSQIVRVEYDDNTRRSSVPASWGERVDPWADQPPFGARPLSGPLSYNGNCPSVVEGRTFRDLGANVIAISIDNCSNVVIRSNDFINVSQGIYAVNSSNITVEGNRYQNITGPHERTGYNRGNFVQFNEVAGGLVTTNKGRCGDTEDIVSLYRTSNVMVEHNHFEGAYVSTTGCLAWRSSSGSGIALGDDGGSGNVARHNILLNPGQVGAFIAGGTNHRIENNTIYGQKRTSPASNVGMYVWNQYPDRCSGHSVSGNRIYWLNDSGQASDYWDAGNCGAVRGSQGGIDRTLPAELESLRVQL